jgi:hypothetical protein
MKDKVTDKCIYFMATADDNKVKIGATSHLKDRIMSIAHHSPIPIFLKAYLPCPDDVDLHSLEAHLHEKFSDDRTQGEFFTLSDDIKEFIETNPKVRKGTDYLYQEINTELLRWFSQPDSKRRAAARKANRFIDNEILRVEDPRVKIDQLKKERKGLLKRINEINKLLVRLSI